MSTNPFETIRLTVEEYGLEKLDGDMHVLLIGWTPDRERVAAYADIESLEALHAHTAAYPEEALVVEIQRRQLAGQS